MATLILAGNLTLLALALLAVIHPLTGLALAVAVTGAMLVVLARSAQGAD